ncbi:MAG: DUF434 domain-containing protein [Lachnospiraceae bacterium]|nr:DUF434 domain-containing protein [Lachnospiraceae bacterium]
MDDLSEKVQVNRKQDNECSRGFMPSDEKEFVHQIDILRKASKDVLYLIEAGYPMKSATTFVGNHYLLSERQRLALARSLSIRECVLERKDKELSSDMLAGAKVHIDGFNTVISLEIAFSGNTLLKCMDGTIRDLAGLRGTYRIIDKTDRAVKAIRNVLSENQVTQAVFYLDAPVSNSGRLKGRIADLFEGSGIEVSFQVINDVDRVLMTKPCVITGDAIILDHCSSWYNLVKAAIEREIGDYPFVEIGEMTEGMKS